MLVLLRRTSFLTPLYAMVYISFHLTNYKSQISWWTSEGSFHVLPQIPVTFSLVDTLQASVSLLQCLNLHISDPSHEGIAGNHLGSAIGIYQTLNNFLVNITRVVAHFSVSRTICSVPLSLVFL